jgi:glycosyltransferase involved in cell wall biosynthesis
LTVGEALAVGTPVVATAVGGIPDLVEHESSGLLVPPQSSVHLANAISALFRDPSLRERIRAGGRTKVQNFDTRAIALQLDGFYRDLVEGSSGRSQR